VWTQLDWLYGRLPICTRAPASRLGLATGGLRVDARSLDPEVEARTGEELGAVDGKDPDVGRAGRLLTDGRPARARTECSLVRIARDEFPRVGPVLSQRYGDSGLRAEPDDGDRGDLRDADPQCFPEQVVIDLVVVMRREVPQPVDA